MSLDKDTDGEVFYSCNIMIMKKYLLETLVTSAHSKNEISFQRNIIMANVNNLKIHAFDATESFVGTIDSVQSYYDISMSLLEKENRLAHEGKTTPNCREKCGGCGVNKCIGGACFE